jgi:arabinofuranosyltransferase
MMNKLPRFFGSNQAPHILLAVCVSVYLAWAFFFIRGTSYSDSLGVNHYVLFDDAMISMRYALNFSNGHGLVWNVGEYVEGYTNPLWTVLMALIIKMGGKSDAPLFVQMLGLFLVVFSAFMVFALTKQMTAGSHLQKAYAGLIAVVITLAYYPVSYWSLVGMEVGALYALLVSGCIFFIKYTATGRVIYLNLLTAGALLSYFVRPDGWIAFFPLLVFCWRREFFVKKARDLGPLLVVWVACLTLVIVHLAWRFDFYHGFLPNTYVLKVDGHPFGMRLVNGVAFIKQYLQSLFVALASLIILICSIERRYRAVPCALLASPVLCVFYQIFVGGDPWPYWRQLSAFFFLLPVVFISTFFSRCWIVGRVRAILLFIVIPVVILGFMIFPNKAFVKEIAFGVPSYQGGENIKHLKEGLVLAEILKPEAKIMTFWAGVIPYFSHSVAIDPLGKTSSYIARLPPDPAVAWDGMKGVPGHDKYDLRHSIIELSPDYIQGWKWFRQDLTSFVLFNYVAVERDGVKVCVKRDSRFVEWGKVKVVGDCVSQSASSL